MRTLEDAVYQHSPWWIQNCLLTAHGWRIGQHRYGRPYKEALRWLKQSETWSIEEVRAYQDERLRRIVRIAYERTRYYRSVFDSAGLKPDDIRSVQDLPNLPLLTKEIVRARTSELLASDRPLRGWLHGHTSGTTGTPLSLWYDRDTCILTNAVDRRNKLWAGLPPDEWLGLLLGRVVVPPSRNRAPFWRTNFAQRQVWFSSFHLSEPNLPTYTHEIRRRRLRALEGYPSTLYVLAKYLLNSGERLPMLAVISSSETLLPIQRETIERAFECELYDFYAAAERIIFAAECERHDGKHLAEEYGYTEVVRDDGSPAAPGESGYLTGTTLHNAAMPLLRYRMGDVSTLIQDRCACGRVLRRIANVTTKSEDIIVTPEGRLIAPSVLTHPFKSADTVVKSQLVQESIDELLIRAVPGPDFRQEHLTPLVAQLRERIGPSIHIRIDLVNDIPREASGKYRWVISKVRHPYALSRT